jgi:hypothetical protein
MLALVILAAAAPALAEEDYYRNGRIRYLEPSAVLQRADEGTSEEAAANMPFLPGDRLWTDEVGRVELQFDDGSVLRLDTRSKLDYLGNDRSDLVSLRLWSGSLYLHAQRDNSGFEIETPGGVVETAARGVYRIDVDGGEARLSVYEGEATLESGRRRVSLGSGERSYARRGESPDRARSFDRREDDEFARWDDERNGQTAWAGDNRRYLPDDVLPYGADLEANGSWYYEAEVGHVWRPHVSAGWRPYSNGRWIWTVYGWTWVPYDSWGWAPFHYGRWGYSPALGWYWIPGSTWGPAWVSWAVGGDYVGWCPLGYRDRPVMVYGGRNDRSDRGHAVPRGSTRPNRPGSTTTVADFADSKAWIVARRADLTVRDVAKRRIDTTPAQLRDIRILESPRLRPTRDLRTAEVHTMTRAVKTKPTVGDFVPELRTNPATTIPRPMPPPRRDREREDVSPRGGREESIRPQPAIRRGEKTNDREAEGGNAERERSVERDRNTERERPHNVETERSTQRERERVDRERERRESDRVRSSDPDREILRRFFEPVGQPRRGGDERDGGAARSRPESATPRSEPRHEPRGASPPRQEPPRAAPPPQRAEPPRPATPPPSTESAKPRDKDRKH